MDKKKPIPWKTIIVLALFALAASYIPERLAINPSDSVRYTLFFINKVPAKVKTGDYVIFTPERPEYKDPYIIGKTIVKKITCDSGHRLSERGQDYYCDGKIWLGRAKEMSLHGHPLRNFVYNGVVPAGYCFVSGSNINSYDSRYWGFLRKSDIKARAYPVF